MQRHGLVPAGDRLLVARATHAPELVWLAGALGLEARPTKVPASTLEAPLWRDAVMYVEQYGDFWNYALNGRWLTKFCVGAAQLDRFGNANNSVIGGELPRPEGAPARHRRPRRHGLDRQAPLLLEPQPQPAGDRRARSTSSRAPATSAAATSASASVSRAARSSWSPTSPCSTSTPSRAHMRIQSVHPGVTRRRRAGGHRLRAAAARRRGAHHRRAHRRQVELIRAFDPDEMRKREFRTR